MAANYNALAHLEPVDLRQIWESEPGDFTPWLAKEGNLDLLGKAIDIELELEAQEKGVGPFRADILCKDTATNDWVVIENQLECTDHNHLGQLLTYSAGLGAAAVVWIAKKFTDEHRAVLDWLNEIAGDRVACFGVEIELWRIAGSPTAPKFNVVCRPNVTSAAARKEAGGGLSSTQRLQQEYWSGLRDVLLQRKSAVRSRKPSPRKWATFSIGRAGFWMYAGIDRRENRIGAGVEWEGANAVAILQLLEKDKAAIEGEIGSALGWKGGDPNNTRRWVGVWKEGADPTNRTDWPAQHSWLAEKLGALHRAFAPRIQVIDLDGEEEADGEQ